MKQKVKKPYKRNISNFIVGFEKASFEKKLYKNEKHEKISCQEKINLGIFDMSHYNLATTRTMATESFSALKSGNLEGRVKELTKN